MQCKWFSEIRNKFDKYSYLIPTLKYLSNYPCFNNNLQQPFNAIYLFDKILEPNDNMVKVFNICGSEHHAL